MSSGHQVVRGRRERHEAAVGADRRRRSCSRWPGAPVLSTLTRSVVAGLPVADEDVGGVVGVARDQVARQRIERDEAAVGADRRVEAVDAWPPASTLTRSVAPVCPVVDEDVRLIVGVVRPPGCSQTKRTPRSGRRR